MSYQDFIENLEENGKSVAQFEEDVKTWAGLKPEEKAATIQEAKEGSEEDRKYILEVSEAAKSNPGTTAGGAGDETGDEIDVASKGGEPKAATDMSDDDPAMSDKGKIAAASGIASGVGALQLAKKLRREQAVA